MACDLRHLLALLQKEASPEDDKDWGANVNSLHEETVSDVRPALLMMRRRGLRSFSSHAGTCPTSSSSAPSRAAKEIDLRSVGASRARTSSNCSANPSSSPYAEALSVSGPPTSVYNCLSNSCRQTVVHRRHRLQRRQEAIFCFLGASAGL
jgi:hypothetical protein